jgi:hypothetical protein
MREDSGGIDPLAKHPAPLGAPPSPPKISDRPDLPTSDNPGTFLMFAYLLQRVNRQKHVFSERSLRRKNRIHLAGPSLGDIDYG